jgi:hypothetical protein
MVCILAPILCFFLDKYQEALFGKFHIGLELLLINGIFTFIGLWLISRRKLKAEGERLKAERLTPFHD